MLTIMILISFFEVNVVSFVFSREKDLKTGETMQKVLRMKT